MASVSQKRAGSRRICPLCKGPKPNFYAKRCSSCYWAVISGSGNPNWRGGKEHDQCGQCGGPCTNGRSLCLNCYRSGLPGLPSCQRCGGALSRHKSEGYCQKCYRGELTKRWNPSLDPELREKGRSINPRYHEWRKRVFERDGYCCCKCGYTRGGNLNAHHIENFRDNPERRTDDDNGITLCGPCHRRFHSKYGHTGNTPEQLIEYLT